MSPLYRPLDVGRREIRILELLSGPFTADIRCKLSHTTLQEPGPVPYEAVSYVWGTPDFAEPVEVNGQTLLVTKNLATALRHLRPDTGNDSRTVWVDAICINQDDVAERNHQVTLMKDIYSHCTADLAWLGPDPSSQIELAQQQEDLSQGLELLKKLAVKDDATLSSLRSDFEKVPKQRRHRSGRSLVGKDNFLLDMKTQRLLDVVLLLAPLWSRTWVIQELALAPRVVLVAGLDTVEWDHIASFLGDTPYADAFHLSWSHGFLQAATHYTFERAQIIQQQRDLARDCKEGKAVSTLMDVLGRFKFADATDPRDHIYGLLGLVTEDHSLKVDYSRPWHLVFADACRYFIESSRTLDIICQNPWTTIPLAPGKTELPTWVADFTSKNFSGLKDGLSALLFAQRAIYQAGCKECQVPCQISDDGATLHVKAVVIGTVAQVLQDDYYKEPNRFSAFSRSQLQGESSQWFARAPREWMEIYFGTRLLDSTQDTEMRYDATAESAFDAFWRTLVMDCKAYPIERLSREDIVADGTAFRSMLGFTVDEIETGHIYEWSKGYEPEKQDLYTQRRSELAELQNKLVTKRMWTRNFLHWTFTVSENGLYCMLKKGALPGDVLAVLDGGKVPVVMRAVHGDSSKFTFVGTAYVHGFMDGEAGLAVNEGRLTKSEVLLS